MADIRDCTGNKIKIGKTTITIKGENGKTCGIVRDIYKFMDLQPNKQIGYFKILRESGVWCNRNIGIDNVVISNGSIFVFRDLKKKQFNEKYRHCLNESEIERIDNLNKLYDSLKSFGIEVIECIM